MPDPATPSPVAANGVARPPFPMCATCYWWDYRAPADLKTVDLRAPRYGECRRYPPTLHAMGPLVDNNQIVKHPLGFPMPNYQPLLPAVPDNFGCGEHMAPISSSPRLQR